MCRVALTSLVVFASGCMGANDIDVQREPAVVVVAAPDADTVEPEAVEAGPAFSLPRGQVAVLPFQVRLAKVARVAGVLPSDALLAPLRAQRLELGDGDYANGIRPDKSWSAAKLAAWIKVLRPVCQSAQLKARFTLPADLSSFLSVSHGRWVDPSELSQLNDDLLTETLTADERHELSCLTVLSSTEFVSR